MRLCPTPRMRSPSSSATTGCVARGQSCSRRTWPAATGAWRRVGFFARIAGMGSGCSIPRGSSGRLAAKRSTPEMLPRPSSQARRIRLAARQHSHDVSGEARRADDPAFGVVVEAVALTRLPLALSKDRLLAGGRYLKSFSWSVTGRYMRAAARGVYIGIVGASRDSTRQFLSGPSDRHPRKLKKGSEGRGSRDGESKRPLTLQDVPLG